MKKNFEMKYGPKAKEKGCEMEFHISVNYFR